MIDSMAQNSNQYRKSMYFPVNHSPRNRAKSVRVMNWDIINVPCDISDKEVSEGIKNWLESLVSFQTPTSLQCNLDCRYCYIEDKWSATCSILKRYSIEGLDKVA